MHDADDCSEGQTIRSGGLNVDPNYGMISFCSDFDSTPRTILFRQSLTIDPHSWPRTRGGVGWRGTFPCFE